MATKKKRRKMADTSRQRSSGGMNITSDWVKTIIAIVVQSIAVGFYLAAVKSDLSHLTSDFTEFKGQMKSEVKQLNESLNQIAQTRSKMESMAENNHEKLSRVDDIAKELRDSQDKIQELKFQLKDTTRDIDSLKGHEAAIRDLQKRIEELKEREIYEKKNSK